MGLGILMCGLNGAGKSTLGRALADRLGYHFIDNEDLYFPKTDPDYMYAVERTQEEVEELLLSEIKTYGNFVFTSVKGSYEKALPFFDIAVLVSVPRELRLERVKERSFKKFGERALPGGDLYEHEKGFFEFISARPENMVEEWLKSFDGRVIRVDGTKPIDENVEFIAGEIRSLI
ncbi:MAG: AAA family ATPase [Ruminococcaceae bacterium]|nr:AAA family ATPase [Oscillospiraceae bacterium]